MNTMEIILTIVGSVLLLLCALFIYYLVVRTTAKTLQKKDDKRIKQAGKKAQVSVNEKDSKIIDEYVDAQSKENAKELEKVKKFYDDRK